MGGGQNFDSENQCDTEVFLTVNVRVLTDITSHAQARAAARPLRVAGNACESPDFSESARQQAARPEVRRRA